MNNKLEGILKVAVAAQFEALSVICFDRPQDSRCLAEIRTVYLGNTKHSLYHLSQRARYMTLQQGNGVCVTVNIIYSHFHKLNLKIRKGYKFNNRNMVSFPSVQLFHSDPLLNLQLRILIQ